jgi:hypothetical protein
MIAPAPWKRNRASLSTPLIASKRRTKSKRFLLQHCAFVARLAGSLASKVAFKVARAVGIVLKRDPSILRERGFACQGDSVTVHLSPREFPATCDHHPATGRAVGR